MSDQFVFRQNCESSESENECEDGIDMTLGEKIIADLTASMKAQDAPRTSTLRMVKAAMMNKQIEKGGQLRRRRNLQAAAFARETTSRLNRAV